MADKDVALRQFLRSLQHHLRAHNTLAETEQALDKWTIVTCQALNFERHDIVESALVLLHEVYEGYLADHDPGQELAKKRLAIVIRLYILGSLAVRLDDWSTMRSIVLKPAKIHQADTAYIHSSWIRHGHVEAARAGLTRTDDGDGGYLIAASRELQTTEPTMHPDIPESMLARSGAPEDVLLNSLCQFDILYCLLVVVDGPTSVKSMYPSSAAFDEARADPALVRISGDKAVRSAVFPNADDPTIAAAIHDVVRRTMQESFSFGGRWWGPPPSVQAFLAANGQPEV
ncbi:hypothetical protein ACNQVK_24970 [Mycobacterium sp. 134]|uniref:hypothetical protein n=1 Tax=Mycobacterium sp. 134 TaxID=3400425 RepID=UPI003AAC20DC